MLAFYLHNLSPEVFRFSDSVVIRWYGLSYVVALVMAFEIVRALARRGMCEMKPAHVAPFMLLIGFVGVMIGGRLGNVVGYHWGDFWEGGVQALGSWRGGMSSHGCIVGVTVVCLGYARWQRISWLGLLDVMVCAGAPGVFWVRLGNFINGEYLGRETDAPWAVKFPTEMLRADFVPAGSSPPAPTLPPDATNSAEIIAFFEDIGRGRAELEGILHPLHPVQLYEGVAGGILLFAALMILRFRVPRFGPGILAGLACMWYAVVRIVMERYYRQPEPWEADIWGMSRGQCYSLCMMAIGLAFLAHVRRRARKE